MNILDTAEHFKSAYTKEYVPFEDNSHNEYIYDKNKLDNFCPKCHYNYNSHYHKTHCNNQLPLRDGIIPLLTILLFYYLIKNYKSWKR